MSYYDKNGIVGAYKGYEVYVINYEDLIPGQGDYLFAVKERSHSDSMKLVLDGMVIGTMDNNGKVSIYPQEKRKRFNFYKPIQKEKVKYEVEVPTVVDYTAYSVTVDNFFKGLNKLWEEIDASLKV